MALFLWPSQTHVAFAALAEALESEMGPVRSVDLAGTTLSPEGGDTVVLVLTGNRNRSSDGLDWLREVASDSNLNLIIVIDDSYLGSDSNPEAAQTSGAAVAAMRSLAVRRRTTVRANAICVPESFTGPAGELRGPLPGEVGMEDIASGIALFAGPEGRYLSGQVLFVNGGRQLFSSLTS